MTIVHSKLRFYHKTPFCDKNKYKNCIAIYGNIHT
jgi:hypothetical protein